MKRSIWNYLIDVGLALSFLGVFATGIFKLPEVLRFLGRRGIIFPTRELSVIHRWSGLVMGLLVFIHLVLHWKWIIRTTAGVFGRRTERRRDAVRDATTTAEAPARRRKATLRTPLWARCPIRSPAVRERSG